MLKLSYRYFLIVAAAPPLASLPIRSAFAAADPPVSLEVTTRTIEVNGKATTLGMMTTMEYIA